MKILSYLLIIFGILWCLLGGYYLWLKNDPNRLNFQNFEQKQAVLPSDEKKETSKPARVIIKDLGINLALLPAKIENNAWGTTYDGASYLASSPIPGNSGNSIIYAHNWTSLFGRLPNAKPGQTVEIEFTDGSKKKFVIAYTSTVLPTESSILKDSQDKRITLYTCTGFLDAKRFVVVALLEKETLSATL